MKNIRFAYAGLLLLLSLLWWMADPLLANGYEYFALRTVAINYTGVIGIDKDKSGTISGKEITDAIAAKIPTPAAPSTTIALSTNPRARR